MSSLGTVKNQLSPASVGCFGRGGSVVVGGECLLFLADKNISVLDLVMPREDYRLADSSSGLYSLSGGWLPVLETGAKVAYIVIGAGWKQSRTWNRGLALSQHGITCLIKDRPWFCFASAAATPRCALLWHVGKCVLDKRVKRSMRVHVFPPPFKRRRPGSVPSRCLLLFPLIDLWDLGFFSLLEPAGDCWINHIDETSCPLVARDITAAAEEQSGRHVWCRNPTKAWHLCPV